MYELCHLNFVREISMQALSSSIGRSRYNSLIYIGSRSNSSIPVDLDRQSYYESPIDYNALGKRLFKIELTSPLYQSSEAYRTALNIFHSTYGAEDSQVYVRHYSSEAKSTHAENSIEIANFLKSEDNHEKNLRIRTSTYQKEEDLEIKCSGRSILEDFRQNWNQSKVLTASKSFQIPTSRSTNSITRDNKMNGVRIRKAVHSEILSRPWVGMYGDLPSSPMNLFAAEVRLQRDYSQSYIKVLWNKLSKAEKYTYEKAFLLTLAMKRKSKISPNALTVKAESFLFTKARICVLEQPAFASIQPTNWLVRMIFNMDYKKGLVPPKFREMVSVMLKHEKKSRAKAVTEMFAVRLAQVKQNFLHRAGDTESISSFF